MKKALKFQVFDFRLSLAVFYGAYGIVSILMELIYSSFQESSNSGFEFAAMIFCFVAGAVMYKEHYWMLAQNGISRGTYYKSSLLSSFILCAVMTVVNQVLVWGLWIAGANSYVSLFRIIYWDSYEKKSGMQEVLMNMLFCMVIYFLTFLTGLVIAGIFQRANKFGRIMIAAGIPVFLFVIAPMSYPVLKSFWNALFNGLFILMGGESGNPLYAMGTMTAAAVILMGIYFPIVKKADAI